MGASCQCGRASSTTSPNCKEWNTASRRCHTKSHNDSCFCSSTHLHTNRHLVKYSRAVISCRTAAFSFFPREKIRLCWIYARSTRRVMRWICPTHATVSLQHGDAAVTDVLVSKQMHFSRWGERAQRVKREVGLSRVHYRHRRPSHLSESSRKTYRPSGR